jgi:hypothetical protein
LQIKGYGRREAEDGRTKTEGGQRAAVAAGSRQLRRQKSGVRTLGVLGGLGGSIPFSGDEGGRMKNEE